MADTVIDALKQGADEAVKPAPQQADDDQKRIAYERDRYAGEVQKLRKELEAIRSQVPSDEDRKKYQQALESQEKAEEERKRKAGEFDSWREQINKKHEAALGEVEKRAVDAETALHSTLIGYEFAAASSLFGEAGRTVLTPEVAQAYLGRHVSVEADERGERRVIVNDLQGHPIVDLKTNRPLPFVAAMDELIAQLPIKDKILRGSGRVGSGSPGGSTTTQGGPIDFGKLKPKDFADPKVRAAVKDRTASSGGIVMGANFEAAGR